MSNYLLKIRANGRLSLFIQTRVDSVVETDHIIDFQDWIEFFSVTCSDSFMANPFDLVGSFIVRRSER